MPKLNLPRRHKRGRLGRKAPLRLWALAPWLLLLQPAPATAMELYSTEGFAVRWDNTVRYSVGARMQGANAAILRWPNSDDGDRNFISGPMTNRIDLLSVLDVTGNSVGLQASLAAWYDDVYFSRDGTLSPATQNAVLASNARFSSAAKDLDGQHVDLNDAFVYGNFDIWNSQVSLRFGRQTLVWGESLFFDQNGIAAAMAPVDYIKKSITPNGYSRNAFLPVDQLSLTAQPAADISVAAYYQFEWRPSRLPAIGSYFSATDVQGDGADRAFLTQGHYLLHTADRTPPTGGQYGVSVHKTIGDLDLGLYAIRYNAKYPILAAKAAPAAPSGLAGTFYSLYPKGITLYGASFSGYIGEISVAGEASLRRNMPLVSILPVSLTLLSDLRGPGGYAAGDSLHGQISAIATLGPGMLWDSADLDAEIAANDRLAITEGADAFNPSRTRAAASARLLFQPHYFQLLPNLDVTPLLGLGFNFAGRSSIDYDQNAGTGDTEVGISMVYRSVWRADLTLTSFAGASYRQGLTDRDFLMLSLERTF